MRSLGLFSGAVWILVFLPFCFCCFAAAACFFSAADLSSSAFFSAALSAAAADAAACVLALACCFFYSRIALSLQSKLLLYNASVMLSVE
jgi:hypothetical protein